MCSLTLVPINVDEKRAKSTNWDNLKIHWRQRRPKRSSTKKLSTVITGKRSCAAFAIVLTAGRLS